MPSRMLQKKIMMGITLIIVVMAVSMIIVVETVLHDLLRKRLVREAEFMARHIAEASITPVLTEKYYELDMMARDVKANEESIEYIYIHDREGRILAHTFEGGFPVDLKRIDASGRDGHNSVRQISTGKGDLLDISAPMLRGSAGAVHLGLSEKYISGDTHSIIRMIIGLTLALLFIMYVVAVLLSRRMVRPVVELARVARAVGEGDLSQKAEIYADDEIGALSRIFNEMIQKRRRAEEEREMLISGLQKALDEVQTLSGLLPICSWCKKIRNDKGYWTDVEAYVSEKTGADFSHGICPDCLKKVREEEGL